MHTVVDLTETNFFAVYSMEIKIRIFTLRHLPFETRALVLDSTIHEMLAAMRQRRPWMGALGGLTWSVERGWS